MASVKLLPGSPVPDRDDGQTFFVRSGQVTLRRRMKPLNPRTEHQLRERAGVSAAARRWGQMTPEVQSTYTGAGCDPTWPGYWVWVWLDSILGWVQEWIEPGPSGDPITDHPVVDPCVFGADPPSVTISSSAPTAPPGSTVSVRLPRPMSPGRRPRFTDMRIVGAADANGVTDLTAEYISRFGRLPIPGQQQVIQSRSASQTYRSASCEIEDECGGGGGDCEAYAEAATPVIFGGGETAVDLYACCPSGPNDWTVEFLSTDEGWYWEGPAEVTDCQSGTGTLADTAYSSRVAQVCWLLTRLSGDPLSIEVCATITVDAEE